MTLTPDAVTQAAAQFEATMSRETYLCYRKITTPHKDTPALYFLGTTDSLEDGKKRCQHNADMRDIKLDWEMSGTYWLARHLVRDVHGDGDIVVKFVIMKTVHRPEGYDFDIIKEKDW